MNWPLWEFALSASGAIVAMLGTIKMANAYHANGLFGYFRTLLDVAVEFLRSGPAAAGNYWDTQAALGSVNPEKRGVSIGGLALIFIGFLLQLAAAFCSYMGSSH